MFVQTHIRRLQPISVNETHVYYQPAMLKGVPPQINQEILRSHETSFGPAGFLSPDDIEVMERNQIGLQAHGQRVAFHRPRHSSRREACRTAQPSATTWTKTSCADFGGIMPSS